MIKILSGINEYEKLHYLHQYVEKFEKEHGGSIERFNGSDIDSVDVVIDAVRSVSFLDPRKLVVIRDADKSKELLHRLTDIIEQTADSTDLAVEGNFDKRTALYKSLKKNYEIKEFNEQSPQDLRKWATTYVEENGGKASFQAISYLIDMVGVDQLLIKNELDKLMLSKTEITKELIDTHVEPKPQSKIFTMLEELFKGNGAYAWELYLDQRSQGEEPQKIIAMLTWQLQQLALAVFNKEKSVQSLQSKGMTPFAAQKSLQLAESVSKEQLRHYITSLADIDYASKTKAGVEPALAVYFSDVAIS